MSILEFAKENQFGMTMGFAGTMMVALAAGAFYVTSWKSEMEIMLKAAGQMRHTSQMEEANRAIDILRTELALCRAGVSVHIGKDPRE